MDELENGGGNDTPAGAGVAEKSPRSGKIRQIFVFPKLSDGTSKIKSRITDFSTFGKRNITKLKNTGLQLTNGAKKVGETANQALPKLTGSVASIGKSRKKEKSHLTSEHLSQQVEQLMNQFHGHGQASNGILNSSATAAENRINRAAKNKGPGSVKSSEPIGTSQKTGPHVNFINMPDDKIVEAGMNFNAIINGDRVRTVDHKVDAFESNRLKRRKSIQVQALDLMTLPKGKSTKKTTEEMSTKTEQSIDRLVSHRKSHTRMDSRSDYGGMSESKHSGLIEDLNNTIQNGAELNHGPLGRETVSKRIRKRFFPIPSVGVLRKKKGKEPSLTNKGKTLSSNRSSGSTAEVTDNEHNISPENDINEGQVIEDGNAKEMSDFLKDKVLQWRQEDARILERSTRNKRKLSKNDEIIVQIEETLQRMALRKNKLRDEIEGLRLDTQNSINDLAFKADNVNYVVEETEALILEKERALREENHREKSRWEDTLRENIRRQIAPKEQSYYDANRQLQLEMIRLRDEIQKSQGHLVFLDTVFHETLSFLLTTFGIVFASVVKIVLIIISPITAIVRLVKNR